MLSLGQVIHLLIQKSIFSQPVYSENVTQHGSHYLMLSELIKHENRKVT